MAKNNQAAREPSAKTELARVQRSREFWEGIWRSVAVVGPAALKFGCIAYGFAKAAEVLVAWTGAETKADVKLNVVTDALSEQPAGLLPWGLVIVVGLLYRRERGLKEKALARLGEVTRKYELSSDPHRSSSQLPPSGQTNPRDPP